MHKNSDNQISREFLISNFNDLEKKFSRQKSDIADKESKFDVLRISFDKKLTDLNHQLRETIGENNPLQQFVEQNISRINLIFDSWKNQVEVRAKGSRFREGFNDSLLVFVYGKVKSGKSSLGNFMAWGHSDPTDVWKAQIRPKPHYITAEQTNVTSGDKEKEAETKQQFRVGATEATSSIQIFKFPGLTWVDSPGLHSVNPENGELATEYVEHADLILYTMHSQAPGRASDMAEVKDLLLNNKKVVVLLTGSDTMEEDEDSEGNLVSTVVMKSESDKASQIAYVYGELEKLKNNASVLADVLPISTRYAEINNTPIGLYESGIGRLFSELDQICRGPALELKLHTPMGNLRSSISLTISDLEKIRGLIAIFSSQIEQQCNALEQDLIMQGQEGRAKMSVYINSIFDKSNQNNIDDVLKKKMAETLQELAIPIIERIGERQRVSFDQAFSSSSLAALPEYEEHTETKQYFKGIKKGNKGVLGLGGAAVGGILGFLAGGLVGAAMGASLGSSVGLAGSSSSKEYDTHDVVVGDNTEERRASAIAIYATDFPKQLRNIVNILYAPTRDGMQDYCKYLDAEINQLSNSLYILAKE